MGRTEKPRILIIDDDRALVQLVRDALSEEGIDVVGAYTAEEGLRTFYAVEPDLVVLDIRLPDYEGWEVCRRLRQVSNLPILMLTALDSGHTVRALSLGADDYVSKPFSLAVLRARIEALLRRAVRVELSPPPPSYRAGDVSIDMVSRKAALRDSPIALTPKEFDLLAYLVRNAGRTVPHQELLKHVWGPEYGTETQYLSLYIWYLRTRIEENPRQPRRIVTWRGLGYRFVPTA